MLKRNTNHIDMDAVLRDIAECDNAALPFDAWKSSTLAVASKTPEHEAELLMVFEERIERKRKRIARLSVSATAAAAAVVMLVLHMGERNKAFSMDQQSPAEVRMEAAALDPNAGQEADMFMAGGLAEREEGIDDLLLNDMGPAAQAAPEEAPVPVPESEVRMYAASSAEYDAIAAVGAYTGMDTSGALSEFFVGASYTVRQGESGEIGVITLDAAYVITLEGGGRYVVSAPDMDIVAELISE